MGKVIEFKFSRIIMLRFLGVFLLALAVGSGHGFVLREESAPSHGLGIFVPGTCPNYTTMADFDVTKYVGRWFEFSKFDTFFEDGQKCVKADYSIITPEAIKVVNSGIYIANNQPHPLLPWSTGWRVRCAPY